MKESSIGDCIGITATPCRYIFPLQLFIFIYFSPHIIFLSLTKVYLQISRSKIPTYLLYSSICGPLGIIVRAISKYILYLIIPNDGGGGGGGKIYRH